MDLIYLLVGLITVLAPFIAIFFVIRYITRSKRRKANARLTANQKSNDYKNNIMQSSISDNHKYEQSNTPVQSNIAMPKITPVQKDTPITITELQDMLYSGSITKEEYELKVKEILRA